MNTVRLGGKDAGDRSGRVKHVPERSCVTCGARAAKQQLVRIVHSTAGPVEVDQSGKKPGRGAYLCKAPRCWDAGIRKGRLEHVLKTKITPEDREKLLNHAKSLSSAEASMQ